MLLVLLVAVMAAGNARAGVTEKTTFYTVSGKTGLALLHDMNRRGPRHGFLTKAIAQTQFKPRIRGNLLNRNGICRVNGGRFDLQITYVYPKPSHALGPQLTRRWKAFHATNVQHERMHGTIAKKMASAMDRKLRTFSMKDGSNCGRAMQSLRRDLDRIMKDYGAEQAAFDKREHRDGGPVERSIVALVK